MGRMRRHTQSNNIVFFAVILENLRLVTLVAIDNKESIGAYNPVFCTIVKVLQPLKTELIRCLSISWVPKEPILRYIHLLIPARKVVLAFVVGVRVVLAN